MIELIKKYLLTLQNNIVQKLEEVDGCKFIVDKWQKDDGNGFGKTMVLKNGTVFESAGVNFSQVSGDNMPLSATADRQELAGRSFTALGVSIVIHPKNPFTPTSHFNVRFFIAEKDEKKPIWWFGGGFDLTPYYGFDEDCIHWHNTAKNTCKPFGDNIYPQYKKWCDEYFYISHRKEQRGIGGLFFDDLNQWDFDKCFEFIQSIGTAYMQGYLPIVNLRKDTKYTKENRDFQLYRRGRYVEFNLIYDRGTLFGLQTKGRVESILMSMPPQVNFEYMKKIDKNSEEQKLYDYYLQPKDWV